MRTLITTGPGSAEHGSAWCDDGAVLAAAWGTYVLTYRTGATDIRSGGTVRLQLPDSWHAWRRNGAKGVQSTDPSADNFVSARVALKAVEPTAVIRCEVEAGEVDEVVKSNRVGLDGRAGRYVYVVRITVEAGTLHTGDEIRVMLGDRSGGSRGFAAALHPQGPELVKVAVDHDGSGREYLLSADSSPWLTVCAGNPCEMVGYLPSTLQVGEQATFRIVVLDGEGNLVEDWAATPVVRVTSGAATLGSVRSGDTRGVFEITVEPTEAGVLRLAVATSGLPQTLSNPSWVSVEPPSHRIYWGDIHSHAEHSFDAVGRFPYEYARDVSCLDFYALTEHCERWEPGDWEDIKARAAKFNDPGRFVTFLAYEATFRDPWGHHNVYFRGTDDGLVFGANNGTVVDLWQALRSRKALTIPHHTGVAFSPKTAGNIPGSTSPAVDWQYHDAEFRRNVEIYSGHGQSEFYDPEFDLSYENSDFSTNTSRNGPHYARDAWEHGHKLGVVSSSDNHRAQPGRGELGLAAVYAPSHDREAIFDALRDRYCYGTTGARILMEFAAEGVHMGGSAQFEPQRRWRLRVSGSATLEVIEIFRGVPGEAHSIKQVAVWYPSSMDFDMTWTESFVPTGPLIYYARARQRDAYRGRKPTAWCSPIWIGVDQKSSLDADGADV